MQNRYLKFLIIALAVVIIVPQIVFASWWNPFSWNWNDIILKIFSKPQEQVQQIQQVEQVEQNQEENQNQNTENQQNSGEQVACTMDAKLCPDGSYVGREGLNCEFKACPKTKNDETADWKTYTNIEGNYSFQYTDSVKIVSVDEEGGNIPVSNNSNVVYVQYGNLGSVFSITNYHATLNLSLDGLKYQFAVPFTLSSVKIVGVDGYKIIFSNTNGVVSDFYFFEHGDQIFKITVLKNNDIANQILSTFKFTDSVDETANWKTYTNTEYGFQFKYPDNFLYQQSTIKSSACIQNECPYIDRSGNIVDGTGQEDNISQGFVKQMDKMMANGKNICYKAMGDPAAGSIYYGHYFFITHNQKCFELYFATKLTNCGVYGFKGEKNYDDCEKYNTITYPNLLNKVISTFKFTK